MKPVLVKPKWKTETDGQYHFAPSQNSHISKYILTLSTQPRTISEPNFLALREVADLKLQWQLPPEQSPLFFVSKVLWNYFQRLCNIFTNVTFFDSFNKNSMSSKNSLTILKTSSSSNNVKFRTFFNIQWIYLMPSILRCLLKTQDPSLLAR